MEAPPLHPEKRPLPVAHGWALNLFVLCIILPILSTIAVGLRFYVRRIKHAPYGADDWLSLVALIFYYVPCILAILSIKFGGTGQHVTQLDIATITFYLKMLLSVQFFYAVSMGAAKCSVCILLTRVFSVKRNFKIACWSVMGLSIAWTVTIIFVAALNCRPISYNWNKQQHGYCANEEANFIAIAAIDVFIDLCILALPISQIWHLQMPSLQKLGLIGLFTLGTFDIIVGIIRIPANLKVDFQGDLTYTGGESLFWSAMEPGVAIILTSAVIFQPLFARALPKSLRSYRSSNNVYTSRRSDFKNVDTVEDGKVLIPLSKLPIQPQTAAKANSDNTPREQSTSKSGPTPFLAKRPSLSSWDSKEHGEINVQRDILVEEHGIVRV